MKLEPADLIGAAHAAGRPAAERDTLYGILRSAIRRCPVRGVKLGYKASAEQFGPVELLEYSRQAERLGLEIVGVSDHFQPWRHHGGHAPAALAWLGAAAVAHRACRARHERPHPHAPLPPVVVAQAFATLGCLAPGRVFLGVGTGEAMNETPATGERVPRPQGAPAAAGRGDRADPRCCGPRSAWTSRASTTAPRRRRSTTGPTSRCRSTSPRPARSPPSSPAASATASSARAARTRRSTTSCSARSPRAPRRPGATPRGIRRMIEVKVSYDRDRERALDNCRWWAALALTPEQKEGVEDPIEMERLADENARPRAHPLHRLGRPRGGRRGHPPLRRPRLRRAGPARARRGPGALPGPVRRGRAAAAARIGCRAMLKDRVMFMSGGSRGIGLAIAARAARDGAKVALMAKTAEPHPQAARHDLHRRRGDRGGRRRGAADRRRHPRRRRRRGRGGRRRSSASAASTWS